MLLSKQLNKRRSETYIIQKGTVIIEFIIPPYAKERIQKALETIQIAREEKSDGSKGRI